MEILKTTASIVGSVVMIEIGILVTYFFCWTVKELMKRGK